MNKNIHDKNYGYLISKNHKQGYKKRKGQVAQTSFARLNISKKWIHFIWQIDFNIVEFDPFAFTISRKSKTSLLKVK